jgi:hypothetical protein
MRAENVIQLSAHAADMRVKERRNVGLLRGAANCERICKSAAGKFEENALSLKVLKHRAGAQRDYTYADAAGMAASRQDQGMKPRFFA